MELRCRKCIGGRVWEAGVPLPSGVGSGDGSVLHSSSFIDCKFQTFLVYSTHISSQLMCFFIYLLNTLLSSEKAKLMFDFRYSTSTQHDQQCTYPRRWEQMFKILQELNYFLILRDNEHLINSVFEMFTFGFNARRELIAKACNRYADCFVRQIVPDRLQRHL